uniref:Secreted protein n=1 Tax=Suricata suricatta TaxID=37032 RepID=A0A673UB04_SURSU
MVHMGLCVFLGGCPFIVCQRGPSLLPNKACVLHASGGHFNLCGNMNSGVKMKALYENAPILCVSRGTKSE